MTSPGLANFLLAHIAEDKVGSHDYWCSSSQVAGLACDCPQKRALAECVAKRRIVAAELLREVGPVSHYISAEIHAAITERTTTPVLRLLALPYADHPEYDEAWRP